MSAEAKSRPPIMTVQELAEYLQVHQSTIYKLLRKGQLPGFRVGTDWRFNADQIDQWCREQAEKRQDED